MKFLFDVYMVISYAMIVGCGIAFVRDDESTKYNPWAYVGAIFWPISTIWMVWESFRDYQRSMDDE
jgi:hypothetical protein